MNEASHWRETSEPLRHWVPRAAIYAVMAGFVSIGIPNAFRMGPGNYSEAAEGRVVNIEEVPREDLRIVTTEFVDASGVRRVSKDSDRSGNPLQVGDTVMMVYEPGTGRAKPAGMGLRILRWFFIALTVALLLFAAGLIARALWQMHRRRWLLQHGRVVQGQAPRLEWRDVPFYREMPKLWRLRASWFDEEKAGWREVATLWYASHMHLSRIEGLPLEIYLDPRNPGRAWMPISHLRGS